jgi:hypothetical protein
MAGGGGGSFAFSSKRLPGIPLNLGLSGGIKKNWLVAVQYNRYFKLR